MKIDFHTHSKYSIDSITSLKTLYKQAKKRGLDGIALTDHNAFNGVKEFKKMLREERDRDFLLIPGIELKIQEGEILALFLQEEITAKTLDEVIDAAKQQDALLCLPHPFDKIRRVVPQIDKITSKQLEAIDAIEVFNARILNQKSNELALEFAVKNKKSQLAGSDAHWWFEVGNAYTEIKADALEEVKHQIQNRKTKVYGKFSNPVVLALTKAVKIFKQITYTLPTRA